jgi:HEPN domain-containing protein
MSRTREATKIISQWVEHAEQDMRLAKHAFKLKSSAPYKLIAYHARQCAEKYLKAYLSFKKGDIPYTHNISLLLELCGPSAGWTKKPEEAKSLTFYAVTTRYPGKDKVSKKEAVQAVETANRVRLTLRRLLRQEGISIP